MVNFKAFSPSLQHRYSLFENKLHYNDTYTIDLNRMLEVIEIMKPIEDANQEVYKSFYLHPEYRLEKYFTHLDKSFLSSLLFLSAYFDSNKVSSQHYKDMDFVAKLYCFDTLIPRIKLDAQAYNRSIFELPEIFFETQKVNVSHKTFIHDLYELSPLEQTIFIKHYVKHMALEYSQFILKEYSGNKQNNPLNTFRNMLEHIVVNYGGDPINLFHTTTPENYKQRLIAVPGFKEGLSYLAALFFSRSHLIPDATDHVPPKIDANDIRVAKLTDILTVHKKTLHGVFPPGLSSAMMYCANELGISHVEVDNMFWTASQAYKVGIPAHLSTAVPFFSPRDWAEHDSSSYYTDGKESPFERKESGQIFLDF